MENNLIHSVQFYWQNIAADMAVVKDKLPQNVVDVEFEAKLTSAIQTASECSNLYGVFFRNHNEAHRNNYDNHEALFYNKLEELIENQDFLAHLQNYIREGVDAGVRYFLQFLVAINVHE